MPRFLILLAGITCVTAGCATAPQSQRDVMYDNYTLNTPRPAPVYPTYPPHRYVPPVNRRQFQETWYPQFGRISDRWKTIVLHHSATDRGSAKLFDKNHRDRGWDELGYHFVIGNGSDTPDGAIEVGPRWQNQKHGAHCKTPDNFYNDHGIGICLVGDFTRQSPTQRQMEALYKLTGFLSQACKIPASRVVTHKLINKKTQCPGDRFPVAAVRRYIAAIQTKNSSPIAATSLNH